MDPDKRGLKYLEARVEETLDRKGEIRHQIKARVQQLEQFEADAGISVPARRVRESVRDLYFSVRDPELRKGLIAKERDVGNLCLQAWRAELDFAVARLKVAQSTDPYWWVSPSKWGILFIGLAYYFIDGQLAFIAFLLMISMFMMAYSWHRGVLRNRDSAIEAATYDLKDAERTWLEVKREPLLFSEQEATTGQPDPVPSARTFLKTVRHPFRQTCAIP